MSIAKVEFRLFSGPAQVDLGGVGKPSVVELRFGPKGDTGSTGATGSTGPAGPNSVTSATTTNITGILGGDGANVYEFPSGTAPIYNEDTELFEESAALYGDDGQLTARYFITSPNGFFKVDGWDGVDFVLVSATTSPLSFRANGRDYSFNAPTTGSGVQWELPNAAGTFALTSNTSGIPDKLANGTITGTLAINSTSYTFGTGAASALKTALAIASADITDATTTGEANKLAKVNASGNLVCASLGISNQATSSSTFFIQPITGEEASIYVPINNGTLALTSASNGEPDKLTNGTITGTLTINSTSYTYGTGAASAHRNALIADKSTIAKTARFVTEGDSITNPNLVANPTQTSWVPFAELLPNFADRTVNNVAVSGSTYTSMIARYASTVYPLRPSGGETVYLITMIGSNDGGTSAATWIAALEAYWTTAKADGFTVVAITTPINTANTNTLAFADAIRKSTVPNVVIDLGGVFKNSTNDTLWLSDDLHPTATGAKLIAEAVNEQITKTNSVGQNALIVAGNGIGVGSTFPRGQVHAVGDFSLVLGSSETANTIKTWSIGSIPYVNAATTTITGMLGGRVDSTTSILYVGRAAPSANTVCTSIQFYTAANITTTAGTLRGSIDGNGKWIIGPTTPSSLSTLNMVESGATLRMSQSTGTQQTSLLFGLAASNGSIATNSLSGEQVNAAPSGTGMSWATATTGNTQAVRFRLRDTGNINFTIAAIPNYANDAAADAALTSGDLYTTTAGGRTVYRKP